ncbi:MAG: xylulokinase [Candidatus Freyarchaeota archaeon]
MKEKFLLGIDVGTSGCKTELFDVNADSIAKAYRGYPIIHPNPGWSEEDPEEWWKAVVDTTRRVLEASKVNPTQVKGVSVSCTNACVPVNEDGEALRNAIMQIDRRTVPQAERIKETLSEEKVFEVTGNPVAPGSYTAPIILWLKENEPKTFEKTYKFMVPAGYIVKKLTGRFTIDWSRAATTLLFDIKDRKWREEFCNELGIPLETLPELHPSWKVIGSVTGKAADLTGLKEGTPVVAGCMDTVAAAVGSGAIEGGDLFCVMGSVARVCAILDKPSFDKRFLNTCHATPNEWVAIGCVNGAGLSLKWFVDTIGREEKVLSERLNVNPYQMLDLEAEKSPPGSGGIIYLPYIAGERSPIWDPEARGVIFGLNLQSERINIVRSFYEGVAYAIRHNVEILRSTLNNGGRYIKLSGGGARSRVWRQIIADVCGKSVAATIPLDTEPVGDALIAGVGTGVYRSIEEAVKVLQLGEKEKPRHEYYGLYSNLFTLYKRLYEHLKEDFKLLAQIEKRFL